LQERGFYEPSPDMDGVNLALPGLPWRWPEGEREEPTPAPALGGDTDRVLAGVLGMSGAEIATLRETGALT